MYPIVHYLKGIFKNFANQRISKLSIISATVKVDKTAYIYRGVKVKNATIGSYSYVGASTDIENAQIGKYCSIADHCRIGMSGHSVQYVSTSPIFTQKTNALQVSWIKKDVFLHKSEDERVYIGNDVWIGSHVLINGGVHIGNGACIGAGAVVVKDVPPYAIVAGVPARIIRYRFSEEIIVELQKHQWWNWPEDKLKANIGLFQRENIGVEELRAMVK